jgi:hypothetical protein
MFFEKKFFEKKFFEIFFRPKFFKLKNTSTKKALILEPPARHMIALTIDIPLGIEENGLFFRFIAFFFLPFKLHF